MKEIKAYKASNGEIFENKEDALARDNDIVLHARIKEFCESNCTYGMDTQDIINLL